jgi:hypothetical protein
MQTAHQGAAKGGTDRGPHRPHTPKPAPANICSISCLNLNPTNRQGASTIPGNVEDRARKAKPAQIQTQPDNTTRWRLLDERERRTADVATSPGWPYQQMITAYPHPNRGSGRHIRATPIDALSEGVPAPGAAARSSGTAARRLNRASPRTSPTTSRPSPAHSPTIRRSRQCADGRSAVLGASMRVSR